MDEFLIEQIMNLQTDDYQNRRGDYPSSNVPDSIQVYNNGKFIEIECEFKNTEERVAENWLDNKLTEIGIQEFKIGTSQNGDYQGDWVLSYTRITL